MIMKRLSGKTELISREDMKRLIGGFGGSGDSLCSSGPCEFPGKNGKPVSGTCVTNSNDRCVCDAGTESVIWEGPYQCTGA